MAKKETGNTAGKDRPYYKTASGLVHPVANAGDDIFGTPAAPGYRGGPGAVGSGNLPDAGAPSRDNGVVKKFFRKA